MSVKGTMLFVSADNLAAHTVAGFQDSFAADKFYRYLLASRSNIQTIEVKGVFDPQTKLTHEANVNGVKRDYVLNKFTHFHTVTGFPPFFLHDLMEGTVPVELGLYLSKLISNKYITLDENNSVIQNFSFLFSDITNHPNRIPPRFRVSGSIGGNRYEN